MADVARLAGVSRSTVSYVLSGDRPISDDTRERVLAAMAELDYAPNVLAQGLAGRRTRLLGLLLPTAALGDGVDTAGYIAAAADEARILGSHLTLLPGPFDDAASVRDVARRGLVDGFVVMEVYDSDARVDYLRAAGIPHVLLGRTADTAGAAFCDADFDAAAELAFAHLGALGHREVAVVGRDPGTGSAHEPGVVARSRAAVTAALRRHRLRAEVAEIAPTFAAGWEAFDAIAATGDATAVVVHNEPAALGLVSAAVAAGLRIPRDLSVLALFCGPEVGELPRPRLTSVGPDHTAMARRAVRFLVERIDGASAADLQSLSEPQFLDRGSTAAPPWSGDIRADAPPG